MFKSVAVIGDKNLPEEECLNEPYISAFNFLDYFYSKARESKIERINLCLYSHLDILSAYWACLSSLKIAVYDTKDDYSKHELTLLQEIIDKYETDVIRVPILTEKELKKAQITIPKNIQGDRIKMMLHNSTSALFFSDNQHPPYLNYGKEIGVKCLIFNYKTGEYI